jgi:hypothetical protein
LVLNIVSKYSGQKFTRVEDIPLNEDGSPRVLSPDDIHIIDEVTQTLKDADGREIMPGYTLSPNNDFIAIIHVTDWSGEIEYGEWQYRADTFAEELHRRGISARMEFGTRETWLASRDASPATAKHGYSEINSTLQARAPQQVREATQRVENVPYLYGVVPNFPHTVEPVEPFQYGSYTVVAKIKDISDETVAYAVRGQSPGRPIPTRDGTIHLLGLDAKDPQSWAFVKDGKLQSFKMFDPTDPPELTAFGSVPMGGLPVTLPEGMLLDEINSETLRPLLDQIKQEVLDSFRKPRLNLVQDLPDDLLSEVYRYRSTPTRVGKTMYQPLPKKVDQTIVWF